MAATERLSATLYDDSDSNSTTLMQARAFTPTIPRGCTAQLKTAQITWGYDDGVALNIDVTNFMGLMKGVDNNNTPITAITDINRTKMVMVSSLQQRAVGTPADTLVMSNNPIVFRNFMNDPSEVATLRQTGVRSNSDNGWSIAWWAIGSALNVQYLATIEFEITYLNGKGNPDPIPVFTKNAMLNQGGWM